MSYLLRYILRVYYLKIYHKRLSLKQFVFGGFKTGGIMTGNRALPPFPKGSGKKDPAFSRGQPFVADAPRHQSNSNPLPLAPSPPLAEQLVRRGRPLPHPNRIRTGAAPYRA